MRYVPLLFAWALAVPGCAPEPPSIAPVDNPAAPGSAQPNLVTGDDGRLYLSWLEPSTSDLHALRFATWNGEGWSSAGTVAAGANWFVNWADFPSLAALADGTLAAHWLVRSADSPPYAYDVWLSVSTDRGTTWREPVRPHDDETPTEHGFVSLIPVEDRFAVIWLDGRETGADPPGPMTLRWAWLDGEGRVGDGGVVDPRVCDCCQTAAVALADGTVVVAYRDRGDTEIRDIFSARLEDGGWSAPSAVHGDGWRIGGCPVNGPALAVDGERVACAWFTMPGNQRGRVRVAFSPDGGRSFGAPVELATENPLGRVDVVWLEDGAVAVSWLEAGADASIRIRRLSPEGLPGKALTVAEASASRASGFPRMARHEGRTFVAWTEAGQPSRVRTAIVEGL